MDITERKEAEEGLARERNLLESMLENFPASIYIKNKEGEIVRASKLYRETRHEDGYEQVLGKTDFDFFPAELAEKTREDERRIMESKEPVINKEEHSVAANGSDLYLLTSKAPFYDEEGNVAGIVGFTKDITDRREAEEELERYMISVESSDDSIYMIDRDLRYVFANDEHLSRLAGDGKISSGSEDEVVGKKYVDIHPKEELKDLRKNVEKVLKTGESLTEEYKFLTEDRWSSRTYSPVEDRETGKVKAFVVVSKDITKRKKMERNLHRKENALESSINAVSISDPEGNYIYVNPAWIKMFGFKEEEALGKKPFELTSDEEITEKIESSLQALKEEGEWFGEMKAERKDGSKFWVQLWTSTINDEEGTLLGLVASYVDITDRKKKEEKLEKRKEELEKSREEYKELINGMNDTVWVIDFDGNFVEVNDPAVEALGYSREELLSMGPQEIDPYLASEEIDNLIERMKGGDKLQVFETIHETKKGEKIPVEISSTLVTYRGEPKILSIARDITNRKKVEEREKFLHSLLRHDLKNKIQVIQGYQELLRDTHPSEKQEEYIEKTMKTAQSGVGLIEKVRSLARIEEEEEMEEIDIDSIIGDVISEKEEQASERGIEINHEKLGCKVLAGQLLKALFSNLIENSIRHSGGNKIRISGRELDGEVMVTFEDDGEGLSNKDKGDVFEKGFKRSGSSGSGLGLYLVEEIAEGYGGDVESKDSNLGGVRFDIRLKKVKT